MLILYIVTQLLELLDVLFIACPHHCYHGDFITLNKLILLGVG